MGSHEPVKFRIASEIAGPSTPSVRFKQFAIDPYTPASSPPISRSDTLTPAPCSGSTKFFYQVLQCGIHTHIADNMDSSVTK